MSKGSRKGLLNPQPSFLELSEAVQTLWGDVSFYNAKLVVVDWHPEVSTATGINFILVEDWRIDDIPILACWEAEAGWEAHAYYAPHTLCVADCSPEKMLEFVLDFLEKHVGKENDNDKGNREPQLPVDVKSHGGAWIRQGLT